MIESTLIIARPLVDKPFVWWEEWHGVANGLTMTLDNKPVEKWGVCPLKIVGDHLETRSEAEMLTFQEPYEKQQLLTAYKLKGQQLENEVFTYDSKTFPLHTAARLRYETVVHRAGGAVLTATGDVYTLTSGNIAAFTDQYYNMLDVFLKP